MSDLIRRDDVYDVLKKVNIREMPIYVFDKLWNGIRDLPSIELTEPERKKGKWNHRKGNDCWECSECHAVLEYDDIANHNFYYCYHCGADMMDKDGYMDLEKTDL